MNPNNLIGKNRSGCSAGNAWFVQKGKLFWMQKSKLCL